ncbi:MAG: hypothetical protein ACPGJU_11720 [Coraliomargarita sp.]
MEKVDAGISKEWRRRMLFMLFMISGIAAWFLYDGYVMWPGEDQRFDEYSEIKQGLVDAGKIDAEVEHEDSDPLKIAWKRHAEANGYKIDPPKERTDEAIREQRVIGWVMISGAAIFGLWVLWNHRLRITTEGDAVIGVSGERVEIDSIVGMDRKKWDNKGIAYAIYEVNGKQKRLCLDEHKFKGCEAIILEAERRIEEREGAKSES